jgi:hypothetical protein
VAKNETNGGGGAGWAGFVSPRRCGRAAGAALTLSLALASSGCAYPLRGDDPKVATMTIEVAPSQSLILPEPGGPSVLTVLETRYLNALEQEVVLGTRSTAPGQNSFHVIFFGPIEGRTGRDNIKKDDRLDEDVLAEEMEEVLPGVPMHTATYFVQNRYGPFGYAIGRAGSDDLCMYAWQRIESQVSLSPILKDRGVLTVKLRLCETGATEQSLLRTMYRYSINGYYLPRGWQPYGRPLPESEGLGRPGGPLAYPTGVQGDATVLDGYLGPEPRPARPARSRAASSRHDETLDSGPPATPMEGYPTVPAPQ